MKTADLRALLAKADSPLPWTWDDVWGEIDYREGDFQNNVIGAGTALKDADGELITAAVNALPALLDVADAAAMRLADTGWCIVCGRCESHAPNCALAALAATPAHAEEAQP